MKPKGTGTQDFNLTNKQGENPTPEQVLISEERIKTIHSYIARLNPDFQAVLNLWIEGKSGSEIAKELDISLNTVSGRNRYARSTLEKMMKKDGFEYFY